MLRLLAAIRRRAREALRQWRLVLQTAVLGAIMPALGWGPFVHPHVNRRALEEADRRARDGDKSVNRETLELLRHHSDLFTFAGNSADAISNFHILHDLRIYDYAHNYIPDSNTNGQPLFGQVLVLS